jgi:tetratricopeptide (TPR) repeat protein
MVTYIIIFIILVIYLQPFRIWFGDRISICRSWAENRIYAVRYALEKRQIDRELAEKNRVQADQANDLIQQAKNAIDLDTYNPFEIDLLLKAIDYYQKSYLLVNNPSCTQASENIQFEIDRRHQFQTLFRIATAHFHHKRFREALTNLLSAQELYSPQQLVQTIADCQEKARDEDNYFRSLDIAKELSYAGKLRDALALVNDAVAKFNCEHGENLQLKLHRAIAAKEQLTLGTIEEKLGDLAEAKLHYLAAISLMPDWQEPQLKIAIVEVKNGEISQGIDRLETIDNPDTKLLAGLLYTQQQEYQKAREIWSKVDQGLVQEYWQALSNITQEQQRLIQPQIKQLVDRGDLEQARTLSLEFINKFGSDFLIETNLKDCILPSIETKMWETEDWGRISIFTHETWLNQLDLKSLHNWAISLYYSTQIDDNLEELIVAWPIAIANIELDPILQDLPWLGTKSPSFIDISHNLWEILEQRIEKIKDLDLPKYLHLRDQYRQELSAMNLAHSESNAKIMVGDLTILPASYQRYYAHIQLGESPQLWKTLYTNWGTAVAACLAGDPQRSATIQVDLEVNSSLDNFAYHFVVYQQGCYYLQQENWRSAIYPLDLAKSTIQANNEWSEKIDDLCANQRRKISDFEEHLDFARFWYDLLSTARSEVYLIEYRALTIHWEWYNAEVTDELALKKIQDLLDAYPHHPVVQEMFAQIYEYWLKIQQ